MSKETNTQPRSPATGAPSTDPQRRRLLPVTMRRAQLPPVSPSSPWTAVAVAPPPAPGPARVQGGLLNVKGCTERARINITCPAKQGCSTSAGCWQRLRCLAVEVAGNSSGRLRRRNKTTHLQMRSRHRQRSIALCVPHHYLRKVAQDGAALRVKLTGHVVDEAPAGCRTDGCQHSTWRVLRERVTWQCADLCFRCMTKHPCRLHGTSIRLLVRC